MQEKEFAWTKRGSNPPSSSIINDFIKDENRLQDEAIIKDIEVVEEDCDIPAYQKIEQIEEAMLNLNKNKAKDVDVYNLPYIKSTDIEISASLIKLMIGMQDDIKEDWCPRQQYASYILNLYDNRPTNSMLNGLYFESQALGKTADLSSVNDLPRVKITNKDIELFIKNKIPKSQWIGRKTLDQQRIDIQVEHFKKKAIEYNLMIHDFNVQNKIYYRSKTGHLFRATTDIFPTVVLLPDQDNEYKLQMAVIDTKLTMDVNSTFGDFSWGTPQYMDHIQADLYLSIIKEFNMKDNPHLEGVINGSMLNLMAKSQFIFLYMVFGYKGLNDKKFCPELQYKPIVRDNNPAYTSKLKNRIRLFLGQLDHYVDNNWYPKPDYKRCQKCYLSCTNGGKCQEAQLIETI